MIKSRKGFMLAEVVITSTVVMTAMIGLYATFNRLYNAYNIRSTYYDIDGIYAIKGMLNDLIKNSNLMNQFLSSDVDSTYIVKSGSCNSGLSTSNCAVIQGTYYIQNMVIIENKKEAVKVLMGTDINQTFKDYLDYVSNYYTFDSSYQFLIIVEYGVDSEHYNYSSLELR